MSSQVLLKLYEQLLDTAGLTTTADGCVSIKPDEEGGESRPFTVKGKRLVMPTLDHLRNPSPKTVVFHPLLENFMRGESEVFSEYRKALLLHVNLAIHDMVEDLLWLSASRSLHERLSPEQSEVLSILKGASELTISAYNKIFDRIPPDQYYRRFVKLFMKPKGDINGKAYTRMGVISFPLYETLADGVEESKDIPAKHRAIIKKAFEYILPNLDKHHEYSRGSNSQVAPMFDAMLKSLTSVIDAITRVQNLFSNTGIEQLFQNTYRFNTEWRGSMDNLDDLLLEIRKVPMQPGNEGSVGESEQQASQEPAVIHKSAHPSAQAAMAAHASPPEPSRPIASAPTASNGTSTYAAPALPTTYQERMQQNMQPTQSYAPMPPSQPPSSNMTFAQRMAAAAQQRAVLSNQPGVVYAQQGGVMMPMQQMVTPSLDPWGQPNVVNVPLNMSTAGYLQPSMGQPVGVVGHNPSYPLTTFPQQTNVPGVGYVPQGVGF